MQADRTASQSRQFTFWLLALLLAYIAFVLWSDREYAIGDLLAGSAWVLLALIPCILLSFGIRYLRWHLLLDRLGAQVARQAGLPAYLSGFALTASPGKAGELIRIRYFARLGVRADATLAAFVYERASDLVVVLGLSLLIASRVPALAWVTGVILAVVLALVALAMMSRGLRRVRALLHRVAPRWIARPASVGLDGLSRIRPLLDARTLLASLGLGTAAWLLPSLAFVGLCVSLGIELPLLLALGIYPAAMLVGALSFVPGGIGTTEATTVLLLSGLGAALPESLAAAVGIRLVTLWLAMLIGAGCVLALDLSPQEER